MPGALEWIKKTMSPKFYDRAVEAMDRALRTGNEHAVTLGGKGWVSPVAVGERDSVFPNYPKHPKYGFDMPQSALAVMHTHPTSPDYAITVAPSSQDLRMSHRGLGGRPIRELIVSPEKNTFTDYTRQNAFDFQAPDKLYFELMKHTGGDMGGIEPIKPDVYFSWLRNEAAKRNPEVRMSYELGDEAPYADEVFKTLKRLGLKKGGLVQMKECNCHG